MFLRNIVSFFAVLVAASFAAASESAYLDRRQGPTGGSSCSDYMCLSATLNGSTVEYVLSSTGKATPGWMAMGFGQQMRGASMVILWSNSDGSITLSQRNSEGHSPPTVDSNPQTITTLAQDLSVTSGDIKYAFTMDAPAETSVDVIYAFGAENPGSSSSDAAIAIHEDQSVATIDLTGSLDSTGAPASPGPPSGGGIKALTSTEQIILTHAILCVIGFLVVLPAGALLARYYRTFSHSWFVGHWVLQFALACPVIVVGVFLGIMAVSEAGGLHLNDPHKKWGIAIPVLYFGQCGLGAIIHWMKPRQMSFRPPQNYLHAVLGLLTIALSMYQVHTGYAYEWGMATGRDVLPGVNIIWIIWVILLPVLYFAGMIFIRKQYQQEAGMRQSKENSSAQF